MCHLIHLTDGLCHGHHDNWSVVELGPDQGYLDRSQGPKGHSLDGATAAKILPSLCSCGQGT